MIRVLASVLALILTLLPHASAQDWTPVARSLEPEEPVERVIYGSSDDVSVADILGARSAESLSGGSFDLDVSEPAELDNASGMVVTEDGAYVVTGGLASTSVVAQAVATGDLAWSTDVGSEVAGLDALGGVVVAALPRTREAVGLDAATGALLWRVALTGEPARVRLSAGGTLAFVGLLGVDQIAVIEAGPGTLRNLIQAPSRITFSYYFFRINRSGFGYLPFEVTADGQRLVAGSYTGVTTYDTSDGSVVASLPLAAVVRAIDLSETGVAAVHASNDGVNTWTVALYDIETGAATTALVAAPSAFEAAGIAVSPDGTRALALVGSQAVAVTPGNTPSTSLVTGASALSGIGDGAAGAWSASGVKRIDLSTMSVTRQVSLAGSVPETPTHVSRRGDGGGMVWTWRMELASAVDFDAAEPETREYVFGQDPELDAPRTLAVSPSGERLAVGLFGSDAIAVYDLATRERLAVIPAGVAQPRGIGFVTETQLLVAGGPDLGAGTTVHLDLETGQVLQTLRQSVSPFASVFSRPASNRFYVFHSSDRQLDGYELVDGMLVPVASYESGGGITSSPLSWTPSYLQVSPTGRHSLSIDPVTDALVVVDLESGERWDLTGVGEVALSAFTPDGKRAAYSGLDGSLHIVDLPLTGGAPVLRAAVQHPYPTFAIIYDAQRQLFVAGVPFGPVKLLLDIDPETGAIVDEHPLPDDFRPQGLYWSGPTGLVVSGTGAGRRGVILTDDGVVTEIGGELGETVLDIVRGQAIVAATESDRLVVVDGVPVSVGAPPAGAPLALTVLGTPARGAVRVRLSGAPRTDARVEVLDVRGRVVGQLRAGAFAGGAEEMVWLAPASGTYVIRLAGTGVVARATVVR